MEVDVLDVGLELGSDMLVDATTTRGDAHTPHDVPRECPGRGMSAQVPERVSLIDDPTADQAVFDAEFVAMMLTEAPWGQPQPIYCARPPRTLRPTRRAARPPRPASDSIGERRFRLTLGAARWTRRRPGPGPRSPPPCRTGVTRYVFV
jgi:hypothetical protein